MEDKSFECSPGLIGALLFARLVAEETGNTEIRPEDLLIGAFDGHTFAPTPTPSLVSSLGLGSSFVDDLRLGMGYQTRGAVHHGDLPLSGDARQLIADASSFAERRGDSEVGPLHLLACIFRRAHHLGALLKNTGLTEQDVDRALAK